MGRNEHSESIYSAHNTPFVIRLMVIVITEFDVFPGQEGHFEELWKQAAAVQAGQPGLLSHRLLRSLQSGSHYIAYATWDSETDIRLASQIPVYQELLKKLPLIQPAHQQRYVLRHDAKAAVQEDDG